MSSRKSGTSAVGTTLTGSGNSQPSNHMGGCGIPNSFQGGNSNSTVNELVLSPVEVSKAGEKSSYDLRCQHSGRWLGCILSSLCRARFSVIREDQWSAMGVTMMVELAVHTLLFFSPSSSFLVPLFLLHPPLRPRLALAGASSAAYLPDRQHSRAHVCGWAIGCICGRYSWPMLWWYQNVCTEASWQLGTDSG